MYSLNYKTKDPLRLFAISHFTEKIGIPFKINCNKRSPLTINYGDKGKGDFSINIPEKEISKNISGNIQYKNLKFPLFQIPEETGEPKSASIAEYESDKKKYSCISGSENSINIGFDLFKEIGYILSGHHEIIQRETKDQLNKVILKSPVVDFHEELLIKSILIGCNYLNLPLVRKSYWPHGKKFAVCLTHDVDEFKKTYQWITRPIRSIKNKDFTALKNQIISLYNKIQGKEPYWTFKEIMEIEKESEVKSTYYFLKENGKKSLLKPENWHLYGRCHSLQKPWIKEIIKELYDEGHEIGVHGSTFSYENPEILKEQKTEIEQISGAKIYGIRQHRLNMNIPITWEYQTDAGLLYDTSLGYKAINGNGFRFGTCFPFYPAGIDNNPMKILEIPLSIMDVSLPPGTKGWDQAENIVNTVEEFNGVLTLLWHPPVFNPLEYPLLGEYYRKLINLCKQKNAWITTGYDIATWWKEREENCISIKNDNNLLSITCKAENDLFIDIFTPGKKEVEFIEGSAELLRSNGKSSALVIKRKEVNNEILLRAL